MADFMFMGQFDKNRFLGGDPLAGGALSETIAPSALAAGASSAAGLAVLGARS